MQCAFAHPRALGDDRPFKPHDVIRFGIRRFVLRLRHLAGTNDLPKAALRHERPFAYHVSGEACSWLGLPWLGTRESLHVLYPAGGFDMTRDPANDRRRDRNHVTLVRNAAAAFNLLQYAARFLPVQLVPISGVVTLSSHARLCRHLAGKRTAGATPHNGRPRIVVRSGRRNLAVEHQGRAIRVLHGIQRASIVTESGHVEHHRVLLTGDVRTKDP
jgi:hypothetical protein